MSANGSPDTAIRSANLPLSIDSIPSCHASASASFQIDVASEAIAATKGCQGEELEKNLVDGELEVYRAPPFFGRALPVYLLAFASFQVSAEVIVSWIAQSLAQYL